MIRHWANFNSAAGRVLTNVPFFRSRVLSSLYGRAAQQFSFPLGNDQGEQENLVAGGDCCVYVHFPFCSSACTYCPFSRTMKTDRARSYCDCLIREIDLFGRTQMKPGASLTSVYFGGGTPSLIPPDLLRHICSRILETFPHNPNLQMTLECNPESLDPDLVAEYLRMGINRLSVGVQSFHAETLAEMGRAPHPDRICQILRALPSRGLSNFSTDLMYGFDSQNLETFLADLRQAIDLEAEHITLYPLVTAHRSALGAGRRERNQQRMYAAAREALAAAGYGQYSTEDFARSETGRDRYEMDSWRVPSKGVVVFGTAGFGTLNHRFYSKGRDIVAYMASVNQGHFTTASCRLIGGKKEARIRMLLGLRYLNVNRNAFSTAYGIDPWSKDDEMMGFLKRMGVVEADETNVRLNTDEYFRYSLLWAKIMLDRLNGNLTVDE
jgi:oxygen-independent coproporphyrinogen-3 oxidase